jgi:hypothetical protein
LLESAAAYRRLGGGRRRRGGGSDEVREDGDLNLVEELVGPVEETRAAERPRARRWPGSTRVLVRR